MEKPLLNLPRQAELFYQQFLTGCLVVCSLMMILWIFRLKTKGKSAWVMSLAFAVMGGLIYTLKMDLNPFWIKALAITLGILLLSDVWIRASNYKKIN